MRRSVPAVDAMSADSIRKVDRELSTKPVPEDVTRLGFRVQVGSEEYDQVVDIG